MQTTACPLLVPTGFLKINPLFFPKNIHLLLKKKKILNSWKPCKINSILYRLTVFYTDSNYHLTPWMYRVLPLLPVSTYY